MPPRGSSLTTSLPAALGRRASTASLKAASLASAGSVERQQGHPAWASTEVPGSAGCPWGSGWAGKDSTSTLTSCARACGRAGQAELRCRNGIHRNVLLDRAFHCKAR